MSKFEQFVNGNFQLGGEAFLRLSCSAAGAWTDQYSNDVGTTSTSGIYHMKNPGVIHAVSAAADGTAIIYLPPAAQFAGGVCGIYAPTGATAGDISVYDWETGAEITTYGDLDADGDHAVWMSMGFVWVLLFDGVA